ncbi:MAG: fumarylacetoacetate hydrolase family protein [Caulobacteraceae bacterium]
MFGFSDRPVHEALGLFREWRGGEGGRGVKLCRFDQDRVGVVRGEGVVDVTDLFDREPRWPLPPGDWMVRQMLDRLPQIARAAEDGEPFPLAEARLESPVAAPGKIIGAPINYRAHIDEAHADQGIGFGRAFADLKAHGLFLKAQSCLIGPSDEVRLRFPERRNDHEVELVVVIGREASQVSRDAALDHVFGYTIGLDMTVRGPEWPVMRKSGDTYGVMGPWIVTADEIADPNALDLSLAVNGAVRQAANTRDLIYDVQALIEYASSFYTLHPGDVIFTGTPEGVSEVKPGDLMDAAIQGIGEMRVRIADQWFSDQPAKDNDIMGRTHDQGRVY